MNTDTSLALYPGVRGCQDLANNFEAGAEILSAGARLRNPNFWGIFRTCPNFGLSQPQQGNPALPHQGQLNPTLGRHQPSPSLWRLLMSTQARRSTEGRAGVKIKQYIATPWPCDLSVVPPALWQLAPTDLRGVCDVFPRMLRYGCENVQESFLTIH